jgi:hypothetical protein
MPPDNEIKRGDDDRADLATIKTKLDYITKELDKIDDKLTENYVTQDQFSPVRNIVFGMVAIILVGIIGALLTLVIRK